VLPLLAAAGALYAFVVVPWRCEHQKLESEIFIERFDVIQQPSPNRVVQLRKISAGIDRCLEHIPNDVSLRMDAAACALMLGNTDEAIEHYRAALKLDQRPEIYLNLGTALYNSGRRQEAVVAFARLYAFATFMVNYDSSLPWSGERVVDLVPPDLQQDVLKESERQKSRLRGRP
jgi:tetratricopeptide (TPR) repeat protein